MHWLCETLICKLLIWNLPVCIWQACCDVAFKGRFEFLYLDQCYVIAPMTTWIIPWMPNGSQFVRLINEGSFGRFFLYANCPFLFYTVCGWNKLKWNQHVKIVLLHEQNNCCLRVSDRFRWSEIILTFIAAYLLQAAIGCSAVVLPFDFHLIPMLFIS